MTRRLVLFAAALVLAAAGLAQEKPGEKPQAQLPAFSESAGSEYVLVPVVVLDKKGRFVEGLEYHEIASTLDIAMGTVQWKIFQVKRKLADRLGVHGSGTRA